MIKELKQKELYKSGEYTRYFAPEKKTFPFADTYEEKRRIILSRLADGGKTILDVGGGRGRLSIPLSAGNRVVMADLSLQMIEEAMQIRPAANTQPVPPERSASNGRVHPPNPSTGKEGGTIDFVCCDAEHPPFREEFFDVVLAIDLLPHMPRPDLCIEELYKLVKPGGTAIIDNSNNVPLWMFAYPEYVDWKRNPIKFLRTFLHGGVLPNWADRITHLPKHVFIDYIRRAGFIVVNIVELGPSYCPKWHLAFCRKPVR